MSRKSLYALLLNVLICLRKQIFSSLMKSVFFLAVYSLSRRKDSMGGNYGPLLANMFLSYCELLFMSNLVKENKLGLVKFLSNISRYLDDLCIVNYKHFDSLVGKIYTEDLIAEYSGSNDKVVDYFDVRLTIENSVLLSSVFHKVDNFYFPVSLLTFP